MSAYGDQFLVVDLEDIASLDALGDNLLVIESLTQIDVKDFESFFLFRHIVEKSVDGIA